MRAAIIKMTFVFAFAAHLGEGQVIDVAGEWRVIRLPPKVPSVRPLEAWLEALPGAVFTLIPSPIPPLAMVFRGLGYTYYPSRPTITVLGAPRYKPSAWGFLQPQVGRRFDGELASSIKNAPERELSIGPCIARTRRLLDTSFTGRVRRWVYFVGLSLDQHQDLNARVPKQLGQRFQKWRAILICADSIEVILNL